MYVENGIVGKVHIFTETKQKDKQINKLDQAKNRKKKTGPREDHRRRSTMKME